ncbi:MAG: sulfite exporter TauE/SafE family protein [Pseudomonadota bacterium]
MAELLAAALGLVAGLVLGLTGAGGSILAVPLLMIGLGWSLPQAAPVALLAVSAAAAFGTVAAWDVSYVRYRAALLMSAAGALASPLGLWAAGRLPSGILLTLFALAMSLVAVRMLRQARAQPDETRIVRAAVAGEGAAAGGPVCRLNETDRLIWTPACLRRVAQIGAATGFLSGLLGVGGGFVIVPALRAWTELSMHSAIATSLMAIALTSGGTALVAAFMGPAYDWALTLPFVAGALGGMLAGRKLAPRIAGPQLQSGFAILMLLTALGLLARTLWTLQESF